MSKIRMNKTIIFLGMPRSGTTLISEYFSMHKDFAWITNYHEKFKGLFLLNLLVPLSINRYWNISGQKKQYQNVGFLNKIKVTPTEAYDFWEYQVGDKINFSLDAVLSDLDEKQIHRIRRNLSFLRKMQFKKHLAFKFTEPTRLSLLTKIFPEAEIIYVERDYLDCISSLLNVNFWRNADLVKPWWNISLKEVDNRTYKSYNFIEKTAFNFFFHPEPQSCGS